MPRWEEEDSDSDCDFLEKMPVLDDDKEDWEDEEDDWLLLEELELELEDELEDELELELLLYSSVVDDSVKRAVFS